LAQAEGAAEILQKWAQGDRPARKMTPLWIGQVAHLFHVTTDMLRNWERNGLIQVPRDPRNRYRLYGETEISRLRVIRLLLRAGYSTMAVLRMIRQLDRGRRTGLREVLDTPGSEEDILYATDRWLSTLSEQEERAKEIIAQVERMGAKPSNYAPMLDNNR
jgi:DNA-binding transcriptional MerR regulator